MVLIMSFSEITPTVQKRILKAFIDLAILRALTSQIMTGYGINGFFSQKLGITASPSMVYASLSAMERKGWIKCVRNRNGRAYGLTDKGKEIIDKMPNISKDIQAFVRILLSS
jgi:DNA-binding PadR family transcriptional regulator